MNCISSELIFSTVSSLTLLWGVVHFIPTKCFDQDSQEQVSSGAAPNKHIETFVEAEKKSEGLTLLTLGLLPIFVTQLCRQQGDICFIVGITCAIMSISIVADDEKEWYIDPWNVERLVLRKQTKVPYACYRRRR